MLFAHPEIYSFPETNFFLPLFGARDLLTMGQKPKDSVRRLADIFRGAQKTAYRAPVNTPAIAAAAAIARSNIR